MDLNTIRDLLGRKSLAMTLRCAHLSPTHGREAVEVLDGRASTPVDTKASAADQGVG